MGLLTGFRPYGQQVTPFFSEDDEDLYLPEEAQQQQLPPPPPPPEADTPPEPMAAPMAAPSGVADSYEPNNVRAPDKSPGGFLKQAAKWAFSPSGLLALGTTLRAGGGNEGAFDDQRAIINRWDANRKEDEGKADLAAKNLAFDEGWVTDDKTGKRKFESDRYLEAARKYGVKADRAGLLKEAKELRDRYALAQGPRGSLDAINEYDPSDRQTIRQGEAESAEYGGGVIERDTGAPGAPAAAAPAAAAAAAAAAAGGPAAAPGAAAPPAPEPSAVPPQTIAHRDAIAGIESRGTGNYKAVGPITKRGDRAYGRYQVMGENIGPWTQEALGFAMTPAEFLANQKAQDAVFDFKFGQSVEKYGSPEEAASVWFTGKPQAQGAKRRDQLGTSGADYVKQFSENRRAPPKQVLVAAGPQGSDARQRAALQGGAGADQIQGNELPPPPPGWRWKVPPPSRGQEPLTAAQGDELRRAGGVVYDPTTKTYKQVATYPKPTAAGGVGRVPVGVQQAFNSNKGLLTGIDAAIAQVKANQKAFGPINVLDKATVAGVPVGEIGMNSVRSDAEKSARAAVGAIAAAQRHDISGAAVTVGEQPYLRPFIPNLDADRADTVLAKLNQMKQTIAREQASLTDSYQGGKFDMGGGADGGAPVQVQSIEEARSLPSGTVFITPDGREKVAP